MERLKLYGDGSPPFEFFPTVSPGKKHRVAYPGGG